VLLRLAVGATQTGHLGRRELSQLGAQQLVHLGRGHAFLQGLRNAAQVPVRLSIRLEIQVPFQQSSEFVAGILKVVVFLWFLLG